MSSLLLVVPLGWAGLWSAPLAEIAPDLRVLVDGRDDYAPAVIDKNPALLFDTPSSV